MENKRLHKKINVHYVVHCNIYIIIIMYTLRNYQTKIYKQINYLRSMEKRGKM